MNDFTKKSILHDSLEGVNRAVLTDIEGQMSKDRTRVLIVIAVHADNVSKVRVYHDDQIPKGNIPSILKSVAANMEGGSSLILLK